MKKIYMFLVASIALLFVSCSNLDVGFEEDSMFYGGGILYIYLDDVKAKEGEYKVYINQEDTEVSLTDHSKTRFGIVPGETNIQVVRGRQTASINIFLQKSNSYYLKVMQNPQGHIELLQVQASAIAADAEESGLYIDDKAQIKPHEEEKAVTKEHTQKKATEKTEKMTQEIAKPKEGETSFSYSSEDGWE